MPNPTEHHLEQAGQWLAAAESLYGDDEPGFDQCRAAAEISRAHAALAMAQAAPISTACCVETYPDL